MTTMMIDDGERVAAGGARLQWHMIPIADIDLIARNTGENGIASKLRKRSRAKHLRFAQARPYLRPIRALFREILRGEELRARA